MTDVADTPLNVRPGQRLRDLDQDDQPEVWVIEQREERIDQHVVYETDSGTAETVYDYHRGQYDPDEPVVRCVYVDSLRDAFPHVVSEDGLGVEAICETLRDLAVESIETTVGYCQVYAFPASRLEPAVV